MESVKTLVVGAGISGLAFADRLGENETLVVEALDEIGGYCKTVEQDGFVWDYSGHFFHFRHPEIEQYLIDRMEEQRILKVEKQSRIGFGGMDGTPMAWVDFPFQKNIHQLPQADFIECLYELYFKDEVFGEQAPANFEEMLHAKFGRGIAERFLIPYNEKLYATDLRTLEVDAMGRFFPYADTRDIIRNFRRPDNASYNAHFTYPEGGAIQYVNALARGLRPDQIVTGERVERIDLAARVAHTSRRSIGYEQLVSAMPLPRLLEATGLPHDADIYTWNKVLVFNLGFDRKGPEGVHWTYFPQRELSFYRVGFYDNIFGTDRMSIYVEIGYPSDATLDADTVAAAKQRTLDDLRRAGLIDAHELVSSHHVVLDPAYVHITEASNADVARKKRALAAHGVHSIGRYGSWTYCSIEDNILEAREVADALRLVRGA